MNLLVTFFVTFSSKPFPYSGIILESPVDHEFIHDVTFAFSAFSPLCVFSPAYLLWKAPLSLPYSYSLWGLSPLPGVFLIYTIPPCLLLSLLLTLFSLGIASSNSSSWNFHDSFPFLFLFGLTSCLFLQIILYALPW